MKTVSAIQKSLLLVVICFIVQLIFIGMCSIADSSSNVPNVMSYEGHITDPDGIPLSDGEYDFTFALYTDPTGGSPVWEERHKNVTVKNGFVQLYLGRGTPSNPLDIPFDQQYFLGIRVGGEPEMVPRLELSTAPYSFRAKIADEVSEGSVTTEKLAPLSITDDKIKSVSWGKITGVPASQESGGPEGGVPSNVWSLFGNRNTDPTKDFLGTTDLKALVLRTNNLERLTIRDTGEVDIALDLNVGNDLDVGNNARIGHDLRVDNDLDVFGLTHLHNGTESDNTTTGALVVDGGVGIAKRLNVGGDTLLESKLTVVGATLLQSDLDVLGITHLKNTTESTTTSTGALIVDGGVGIAKRLNVGGDGLLESKLDVLGLTHLQDDTQSDNTTTGALVVDGGVGIAKQLNVGGDGLLGGKLTVEGDSHLKSKLDVLGHTHLQDNTQSYNTTTGALVVDGGVGIAKRLNVGGITQVRNTTESTSTDTGALVVDGGAGVGANLNVGGSLKAGGVHVKGTGNLGPNNQHIAYFENTSGGNADGIAIKINTETSSENNFVTFYKGSGEVAGRIEGFRLPGDALNTDDLISGTDWLNNIFDFSGMFNPGEFADFDLSPGSWDVDWKELSLDIDFPGLEFLSEGILPEFLATGVTSLPDIGDLLHPLICWAIDNGFDGLITTNPFDIAVAAVVVAESNLCKDGGVTYGSGGADYAEWLPKLDPEEKMSYGQIVGVHGGKITRKTAGAEQIMAISTAPVVVGNIPPEGEESGYAKVAFMGQVPVLVRGEVKIGDFIIPSGRNDGIGVAISPDDLKLEHLRQILGRAWSESTNDRLSMINVLVGVKPNELIEVLEQQQERADMLEARVERLESLLGGLAADQESSVKMIGASK